VSAVLGANSKGWKVTEMVFLLIYIFLCLVVATLGIGGRLGYFWTFLIALLLTPFSVLIGHMIRRISYRARLADAKKIVDEHERRVNPAK